MKFLLFIFFLIIISMSCSTTNEDPNKNKEPVEWVVNDSRSEESSISFFKFNNLDRTINNPSDLICDNLNIRNNKKPPYFYVYNLSYDLKDFSHYNENTNTGNYVKDYPSCGNIDMNKDTYIDLSNYIIYIKLNNISQNKILSFEVILPPEERNSHLKNWFVSLGNINQIFEKYYMVMNIGEFGFQLGFYKNDCNKFEEVDIKNIDLIYGDVSIFFQNPKTKSIFKATNKTVENKIMFYGSIDNGNYSYYKISEFNSDLFLTCNQINSFDENN